MLVQIYEVQTPEEALALARLGVDHIVVLVGDGAFPRELPAAPTRAIFAAVPSGAKRVALSLSADREEIARVAGETRPDIIQVQAAIEDFSVAMTRALKTQFPEIPIMRAIPVIDGTSIEIARSYQGVADFLLLDSYDADTRQFGALGRTHDWSLSRRIVDEAGIPAILAGGLGSENVAEAIAVVRPAWIRRPIPIERTGPARISQRYGTSSPQRGSPGEGSCPQLDGAIVLNDPEQPQPAREPGCAALVIPGSCDELRIVDRGLAGLGRAQRQGERRQPFADSLLLRDRRQRAGRRRKQCGRGGPTLHRARSEDLQHCFGGRDIELTGLLDVQRLHDAVLDQHRIAL
jgi:phosphoribosylanthranilate isomerase